MRVFIFYLSLVFIWSCQNDKNNQLSSSAYQTEIDEWRKERVSALIAPQSWTSLAALDWLEEGENAFGSNKENIVVFPESAPSKMGVIKKEGEAISFKMEEGITANLKDSLTTGGELLPDASGKATVLKYDSFIWLLIKRGDKFGIRIWDTLHVNRQNFKGIDHYPDDENWKLEAQFVKYDTAKIIPFKNVLGMNIDQEIEGKLEFEIDNKKYTLDVLDGGAEEFFVILADDTTGDETYGGGRYLYVDRPDENGKTFIDFNKAHTPPCGYTDYATCLLPPSQNRLAVAILAGEKYESGNGH